MFGATTRAAASAGIAAAARALGLSTLAAPDRHGYVLAHSLASAPFALGALVCSGIARRRGAPEFRSFWGCSAASTYPSRCSSASTQRTWR